MVESAEGTSGKCSDYVANIRRKLSEFGIEDEAVEELWKSMQAEDLA
jgi:cation transport regulator ChaC